MLEIEFVSQFDSAREGMVYCSIALKEDIYNWKALPGLHKNILAYIRSTYIFCNELHLCFI